MSNTSAPLSLNDLQKIIRKFCDDRDWDQFHNPKDLSISMMLEAGEVLEHFQWKNLEEMATYSKEHKSDIAEEVADVFYWVLLLSNKLDIDLVEAFQKKMVKNEQKYPIDKAKGSHKKYTELSAE
ncbi:MAG: nucleotide pyrophosphohydrolase [Candidatus Saccharimonadales bacterium]